MTRAVIRRRPKQPRAVEPTVDMTATLVGVDLPSPVLTASGCAAAGRELDQFFDITTIGAVVTKSVMLQPRSGRPTPRMAETPSGMLNSIGLQGPGIEAFLDRDLAWLHERGARVVVSIAGGTVDEYSKLAQKLRHVPDLVAIEVNISCPNVEDRGQVFACDPDASFAVVQAVRRNSDPRVPVLAKLSPDVTDIVSIATRCVEAGATGLSMINTTLGMVIDTDTLRPALAGVTGGLSGPAIRPIAVRCVWQVRQALPDIPILGMGGIRTGLDALEFILAGANAVSVGTVVFNDPSAPVRIHRELAVALDERGFDRLADAVSYAHRPAGEEPEPDPEPDPAPAPARVTGPRLAAAETGSMGPVDAPDEAAPRPARRDGAGRSGSVRRVEAREPAADFGGGFIDIPRRSTDPDRPFDQESDW